MRPQTLSTFTMVFPSLQKKLDGGLHRGRDTVQPSSSHKLASSTNRNPLSHLTSLHYHMIHSMVSGAFLIAKGDEDPLFCQMTQRGRPELCLDPTQPTFLRTYKKRNHSQRSLKRWVFYRDKADSEIPNPRRLIPSATRQGRSGHQSFITPPNVILHLWTLNPKT